jgi:Nif-specific regulatory protein
VEKYAAEFGTESRGFSQEAGEALRAYEWPGNVRELENEVQRGLLQCGDGDFIGVEHLSARLHKSSGLLGRVRPPEGSLKEMMAAVEQRLLVDALSAHKGNKTATAKSLSITREGLHKKLKRYGITS